MENVTWMAIVALIASVTTLTEFFKRLLNVKKAWFNEILGFVIAIITAYIAWILGKLPTWFEPEWQCTLLNGIFLGVATRFTFKLETIRQIFDIVFQIFGKGIGEKRYNNTEDGE